LELAVAGLWNRENWWPGGNARSTADTAKIQRNLRAAMKKALRIRDRFVAEPVFENSKPKG
jgi:hypothetical protein